MQMRAARVRAARFFLLLRGDDGDACPVEAEGARHRGMRDAPAAHVDAGRKMRIAIEVRPSPLSASLSTNGSVALFSACAEVTGTQPGMLATQ